MCDRILLKFFQNIIKKHLFPLYVSITYLCKLVRVIIDYSSEITINGFDGKKIITAYGKVVLRVLHSI